jgi:hypothetical protein
MQREPVIWRSALGFQTLNPTAGRPGRRNVFEFGAPRWGDITTTRASAAIHPPDPGGDTRSGESAIFAVERALPPRWDERLTLVSSS